VSHRKRRKERLKKNVITIQREQRIGIDSSTRRTTQKAPARKLRNAIAGGGGEIKSERRRRAKIQESARGMKEALPHADDRPGGRKTKRSKKKKGIYLGGKREGKKLSDNKRKNWGASGKRGQGNAIEKRGGATGGIKKARHKQNRARKKKKL